MRTRWLSRDSPLDAMREKGTDVHEVRPGALGQDDLAELIAESFNQEVGRASALARLVTTKTGGNPFFVRRLLHTLHGDGLIRFASQRRACHPSATGWCFPR
jgi:predicted ATPase